MAALWRTTSRGTREDIDARTEHEFVRAAGHARPVPLLLPPTPWNRTTWLALAALVGLWVVLFASTWASWGSTDR